MARRVSESQTFVRALHRRLVFVRAVEHAGLGALVGCGAAALVIPLLGWREQPALPAVVVLLTLGTATGLLWAVTHRPSRLAAAMEADRQLRLHDLLGTAVSVADVEATDGWARTVLAIANERCLEHAPAEVILRRYGSRAWGGIGLAATLVLTLSALLGPTGTTPIEASSGVVAGDVENTPEAGAPARPGPIASTGKPGAGQLGQDDRRLDDPGGDDAVRRGADDVASRDAGGKSGRVKSGLGSEGQGGGVGRSGRRSSPPQRTVSESPPGAPAQSIRDGRNTGPAAGGGADARSTVSARDADTPGISASSGARSPSDRIAPWESGRWSADARVAQEALDAGHVPDEYRDLVRGYFER